MNTQKTDRKKNHATDWNVVRRLLVAGGLLAALPSAVLAFKAQDRRCSEATPVDFGAAREVRLERESDGEVFRLEVPSAGVLILEASPPREGLGRARIDFLAADCPALGSEEPAFVERSATSYLAKVSGPGSYFVGVSTGADRPGAGYGLRLGFSPGRELEIEGASDPGSEEGGGPAFARKSEEEAADRETDPISGLSGEPGQSEEPEYPTKATANRRGAAGEVALLVAEPGIVEIGSAGILLRLEPGRYHLGASSARGLGEDLRFYPLCPLEGSDDHGESFTCASAIALGGAARGEISASPAVDVDVFAFTLAESRTVILRSAGETDLRGQLFDELGVLLAADDDGAEAMNFRIVETLRPGRYFLRVAGVGGSQGSYALTTAVADGAGDPALP